MKLTPFPKQLHIAGEEDRLAVVETFKALLDEDPTYAAYLVECINIRRSSEWWAANVPRFTAPQEKT